LSSGFLSCPQVGIEECADLLRALGDAITLAVQEHQAHTKIPLLRSESIPLGVSLPPCSPHAVGVSMPRWEDVVAYEEGSLETPLQAGYPRFVYLKTVQKLFDKAQDLFGNMRYDSTRDMAMALPSASVALRCQRFLKSCGVPAGDLAIHDMSTHGVFAITFPVGAAPLAKQFHQHTGEIISSRLAAAVLDVVNQTCYENEQATSSGVASDREASPPPVSEAETMAQRDVRDLRAQADYALFQSETGRRSTTWSLHDVTDEHKGERRAADRTRLVAAAPLEALGRRVASLADEDHRNVFLYPTGMAAIAAANRLTKLSSQWTDKPLRTVIWGWPYLDTMKLVQHAAFGSGAVFFGRGDEEEFAQLRTLLARERIGGLWVEFPSNPLLRSPDLQRLRRLADEHGFPIICALLPGGSSKHRGCGLEPAARGRSQQKLVLSSSSLGVPALSCSRYWQATILLVVSTSTCCARRTGQRSVRTSYAPRSPSNSPARGQ